MNRRRYTDEVNATAAAFEAAAAEDRRRLIVRAIVAAVGCGLWLAWLLGF